MLWSNRMVKRKEFEDDLIKLIAPAVTGAQYVLGKKYNVKFKVRIDWELSDGHNFDDSERIGG